MWNAKYSNRIFIIYSLIITCFLNACNIKNSSENPLFESLKPTETGVTFSNIITTSDSLNLLNFEYIYIGGGVGIGDFNADGLSDIFLTGNMVPSKLYLNKGNLKFQDITAESGIKVKGWAFGVSVADVNGDGLEDIYISMGGNTSKGQYSPELFINKGVNKNGIPEFEEMAKAYGLNEPAITIQSVFFDYDKDGDLDLYCATGSGYDRSPIVPYPILKDGSAKNTDRLYRNDFDSTTGQPHFTNVSKEANIVEEGFGLGVSIVDINEDGWTDIYVTNDYLSNDLLYINNQKGGFTNVANSYFNHTSHNAMGNDIGDINNDGLMDFVAVDMLPEKRKDRMQMLGVNSYDKFYYAQRQGYISQYMRNTLQLNNGSGLPFSEIAMMAGVNATDWSWSPLIADFDNDGWKDLFISNGYRHDITDMDFITDNAKLGQQMQLFDADKIIKETAKKQPEYKTKNRLFRNTKGLTFEDITHKIDENLPSFTNGATYADLDNDGDLDLITNNIDEKAEILENISPKKNYLKINLSEDSQNRFALGAEVLIFQNNTSISSQRYERLSIQY